MKLQSVLTLVLGSVFLSSCATAPDRPSPEVAARMKRLAVVSIIGREITRSYIGVTVFGNEFHKEDIADWNLDSEYERQLTNAVGVALPGATVVPDRVDRQAIAKIDVLGRPIQMQSIGTELTVQCVASGVDGILIATRPTDRGIGVWVSRQYNVRELAISASISLFDCSSAKFVATQPLVEGEPKDFLKIKAPYPRMDLREEWPVDGEWSKSTLADVHPYLMKLPEASWPYTVRKLFGQ